MWTVFVCCILAMLATIMFILTVGNMLAEWGTDRAITSKKNVNDNDRAL